MSRILSERAGLSPVLTLTMYPCGFRKDIKFTSYEVMYRKKDFLNCRDCDWECFRDPSNLLTPLNQFISSPARQINFFYKNRNFFKTWIKDLIYYSSCNFLTLQNPLKEKCKFSLYISFTSFFIKS